MGRARSSDNCIQGSQKLFDGVARLDVATVYSYTCYLHSGEIGVSDSYLAGEVETSTYGDDYLAGCISYPVRFAKILVLLADNTDVLFLI